MTLIGKLLAFLNLVVGLGIVSWATTQYVFRPGWFDPIPEHIEKGHDPINFAMLQAEVAALGKAADAASGQWGEGLKALQKVERERNNRRSEYAKRLVWMQKGNPDKAGTGFFQPVYLKDSAGKDSGVLQLYDEAPDGTLTSVIGDPIVGPDTKPLKGVEGLLATFNRNVTEVERLALLNAAHRKKCLELSDQILAEDKKLDAMLVVRDSVLSELFYLATFELNVYETRTTVFNRKRQLVLRLAELGGVP